MFENLRELFQYRALLSNLVGRELKVRYRGSSLGFLWTFLNPILLMGIYSLVFSVYMRSPIENFSYFMFVGLLPWLWFSTSVLAGTAAISDRRDLITKVHFPPQILPATVIFSSLTNYLLTLPLMLAFAAYKGIHMNWSLLMFPVIVFIQVVLTLGVVYITASINVMFRDLQHIVGNVVTFLFFLTPIAYSVETVPERWRPVLLSLNPMAILIGAYQDIFYYGRWPGEKRLALLCLVSIAIFALGSLFMSQRREDFAEVS